MKQKGLAPLVIIILIALVVGGYLIYQKQLKPAAAPQQTTQSSPSLVASDETISWKTYTNTRYNFSISYPDNWYAVNDPYAKNKNDVSISNAILLTPDTEKTRSAGGWRGLSIEVIENRQKLPSKEYVQKNIIENPSYKDYKNRIEVKNANLTGIDGLTTEGEPIGGNAIIAPRVYISKDNWIIKMVPISDLSKSNQILSTFKFTQ